MVKLMHIGVNEPIGCRKKILSSTIDTIQILKQYEKFKQIQKEKSLYEQQLEKNLKELKETMKKLAVLPKIKISEPRPEIKKTKKKTKKTHETKKKTSKLDKDIEALRDKIRRL